MWSDDVMDNQLDDIYKRLKREADYEAKDALEAEWRKDLPILQDPQVGATSPGRPSAIKPMQPFRTPSRKTSSNRYHGTPSPLSNKRGHARPMFSRPPGPPKATRLSRNSLLAGTESVRNALRQAARNARLADVEFEDHVPANTPAPAPMALDGPLRAEEFEMAELNFARWIPATYMWRLDEAALFRDILNNSGVARTRRMIFWLAPDPSLAAVMQGESLSPSTLNATLRAHRQSGFADLIATRAGSRVDRLVFAHCDGIHWTLHDHDLTRDTLTIRTWNSLQTNTHIDLTDQLAITTGLRRVWSMDTQWPSNGDNMRGDASTSSTREAAQIDPQLLPVGHTVLASPTGLQVDSFSCGFWATFFAWATLLEFNPHEAESIDLGVPDLKGIFAVIWIAYRTRHDGVPTSFVKDIFSPLGAKVDWSSLGPSFSVAPTTDGRSLLSVSSEPVPPLLPSSGTSCTTRMPSIRDDARLQEKLRAYRGLPTSSTWRAANDTFKHEQLLDLLGPRMVVNEILDACLALIVDDLRQGVWDPAFGDMPESSSPNVNKVVLCTWSDIFYIRKASPLERPGGLAPPTKTRSLWFPKINMFDQDLILLPWYWTGAHHFMCGVIDCRQEVIAIYDSMHDRRRVNSLHNRLLKMVEFEYRARIGANFQETRWAQEPIHHSTVPQQTDTYNCAAYTLKYALEWICGRRPERAGWSFTTQDAMQLREAMALRLLQELDIQPAAESRGPSGFAGAESVEGAPKGPPSKPGLLTVLPETEEDTDLGTALLDTEDTKPTLASLTRPASASERDSMPDAQSASERDSMPDAQAGEDDELSHPAIVEAPRGDSRGGLTRAGPLDTIEAPAGLERLVETVECVAGNESPAASALQVCGSTPTTLEAEPLGDCVFGIAEELHTASAIGKNKDEDDAASEGRNLERVASDEGEADNARNDSVSASRRRSNQWAAASTRILRSTSGRDSARTNVSADSRAEQLEHSSLGQRTGLPVVGDWYLLVYSEPIAAGWDVRAVPAQVSSVNASKLLVTLKPDASILWMESEILGEDATSQAQMLLKKTRRISWKDYGDSLQALSEDEIARMQWPAALQYQAPNRRYSAVGRAGRAELCTFLETLFPAMTTVLGGEREADVLFSTLVRDGMRSHGYDDEGEVIPGLSQFTISCQEFFDIRTRQSPAEPHEDHRKLLDAGDEALIAYLSQKLGAQQPVRGPLERLDPENGDGAGNIGRDGVQTGKPMGERMGGI
ncbi:hypothetical protein K466DRAFT_602244 [Polyporus arcularius HHB13444]|uniref:Ubiquitin-like protease family profile domain-containing protein n=1 Tax=Polyporus arcularius HHB13444 TaxID=1314778 RepID=A0A5C3P3D9_9APHY|nr:hypothetical protein K466DRAFT_602244 [Polyporus arcularius HHB13444]